MNQKLTRPLSVAVFICACLFPTIPPPIHAQEANLFGLTKTQEYVRELFRNRPLPLPQPVQSPEYEIDGSLSVQDGKTIPNFGPVSPGIYRSGQPSQEGLAELKYSYNIRTILNLTLDSTKEQEEIGRLGGMTEEPVPMSNFRAPTFDQVDQALAILSNPDKRPILVHCTFGKDRTGFVVAAYRVIVEKMDLDQAVREAKSYSCCFFSFGSIRDFLVRYREHRSAIAPSSSKD